MIVHDEDRWSLLCADVFEALKLFGDGTFDSIVTDPPYELGFMGKAWDATGIAYSVDLWREVLRVLKPGGHLLAFGGTRTYHRMTCAIEDAGFEIRDSLHWLYGTGFPKSLTANTGMPVGQGTALKPAHEPIVLARRPLDGTVAVNVARHGTGGIQIDACRIAIPERDVCEGGAKGANNSGHATNIHPGGYDGNRKENTHGRWPANVLLDEDAAAELDAQSGTSRSSTGQKNAHRSASVATGAPNQDERFVGHADSGGASRFFYVSKPSRRERDLGCEHLSPKTGGEATDRQDGSAGTENPRAGAGRTGGARNYHPTVKPVELMRYLVRLVTPPGGAVLDPFTGSGTTGMAAMREGLRFVGVDLTPEYIEIAKARILASLTAQEK